MSIQNAPEYINGKLHLLFIEVENLWFRKSQKSKILPAQMMPITFFCCFLHAQMISLPFSFSSGCNVDSKGHRIHQRGPHLLFIEVEILDKSD